MRRLTARHVSLANTVQEAAPRVNALATVLLVGTPQRQLLQVQQQLTALRVMPAAMVLVAVILASVLVSVRQASILLTQLQLGRQHRTALRVMLVDLGQEGARRVSALAIVR